MNSKNPPSRKWLFAYHSGKHVHRLIKPFVIEFWNKAVRRLVKSVLGKFPEATEQDVLLSLAELILSEASTETVKYVVSYEQLGPATGPEKYIPQHKEDWM